MLLWRCRKKTCRRTEPPDGASLRPSNSTRADMQLSTRQSISLTICLSDPHFSPVSCQLLRATVQRLNALVRGTPFRTFPLHPSSTLFWTANVPNPSILNLKTPRDQSIARLKPFERKQFQEAHFANTANRGEYADLPNNRTLPRTCQEKAFTQLRRAFCPPQACSNAAQATFLFAGRQLFIAYPEPLRHPAYLRKTVAVLSSYPPFGRFISLSTKTF